MLTLVALIIAILGYIKLRASLPLLEGERSLAGISASVLIERDFKGVPTINGQNRRDVTVALGFLHGEERLFQMDLMRRKAAGELAELIGDIALPFDKRHRVHRLRSRARQLLDTTSIKTRDLINAYTIGVNQGFASLRAHPWEYLVLQQTPVLWKPEDTILVIYSMFFELTDTTGSQESMLDLLHEALPEELARFLAPPGTEWDAPMIGEAFITPTIPGPDVLYSIQPKTDSSQWQGPWKRITPPLDTGSNNWAVSSFRSQHGGAMLANDMHLGHSVPNIWYRAAMMWTEGAEEHRLAGLTLPGTANLIAGSNGNIAWGFTNANGDWTDLVEIELNPNDTDHYLTPEGTKAFERYEEILHSKSGKDVALTVRETIWGPIIDTNHLGRLRALRWIGHDPDAVNFRMADLETARTLKEALAIATRAGIPPQNFVCVDRNGSIGWTIAGKIPERYGFDGQLPSSWANGKRGWKGRLSPELYPSIVDPKAGVIWTANARVGDGELLATIGDGGYALGARARQIRDSLMTITNVTEEDLLDIQLDDRALFLERWRNLLLLHSSSHGLEEFHHLLKTDWSGHASIDSAGYFLVKHTRLIVFRIVYESLTADVQQLDRRFNIGVIRQWEGPLWRMVTEEPKHLLPASYKSWSDLLVSAMMETIHLNSSKKEPMAHRTWGQENTSAVRHPLSQSLPFLSRWINMPPRPLPGDSHMPRVQRSDHGASERFVVSPGRENEGILHMPGGQTSHPLSPYFGAGHEDWEEGRPTAFLPGPTVYRLTFVPAE